MADGNVNLGHTSGKAIARPTHLARPLQSADPPPEFTAQGAGGITMEPGLGLSIYGSHLGPGVGCVGSADRQHRETPNPNHPRPSFADTSIYPTELCETRAGR